MPYKCGYGCTSYNPSCDACNSATTGDNSYDPKEDDELHKAACRGQTRQEYLDDEDRDDD